MTNNKIHTSNVTLTDKQIINAIFKEFRKDDLIDIAKQDVAMSHNTAFDKITELGGVHKSYVFTSGEHSRWAFDKNGNILQNRYVMLDWANRLEEDMTDIVGKRIKEIVESFGYEIDWDGSWHQAILIKAREGVFWGNQEKQWLKIEEEVNK